jgi:hypothetical protein
MLVNLEGFTHARSIDLIMGHYHIELPPNAQRLCAIILHWGKCEYQKLPMGLSNSPDIFQECMSNLMTGLEFCRVYIDDLPAINKGPWEEHLQQLEQIFIRLQCRVQGKSKETFFWKNRIRIPMTLGIHEWNNSVT